MDDRTLTDEEMIEIEETRKAIEMYVLSKDSNLTRFLKSRRGETSKQRVLDIVNYLAKKKDHEAPLRKIKKDFRAEYITRAGINHETTFYRLLDGMVKANVLEKEEKIEHYSKRSKPDKRMKNTWYKISKEVFNHPPDPEVLQRIKEQEALAKYAKELSAAKELLKEHGICDPADEIIKRVQKKSTRIADDEEEELEDQEWKEHAREEWNKLENPPEKGIVFTYKGMTRVYHPEN